MTPQASADIDLLAQRAHAVRDAAGLRSTEPVPSPCASVCRMNNTLAPALCEGCLRTLDEIAGWRRMDDADKRRTWARIARRIEETTPP